MRQFAITVATVVMPSGALKKLRGTSLDIIAIALVCVLFAAADAARGGIVNGGFESGGTGWTLTNGPPPAGDGGTSISFPTSGTAAVGTEYARLDCIAISALTPTLNVRQGYCTISQTFTANAGDWVSFDYRDQLSPGGGGLGGFNTDTALIVSCGGRQVQDEYLPLRQIGGQALGNGWYTYSFPPFTSAGTYTFTAEAYSSAESQPGDVQNGTPETSHTIADIDAVTLNTVPEPYSVAVVGAGAAALCSYRWRWMRRRKQW
jgi:hypothetical protein